MTDAERRLVPWECADCGRLLFVPEYWVRTTLKDRARGTGVQRRIVCTTVRHQIGCLVPGRDVVWAGLESDTWALVASPNA